MQLFGCNLYHLLKTAKLKNRNDWAFGRTAINSLVKRALAMTQQSHMLL